MQRRTQRFVLGIVLAGFLATGLSGCLKSSNPPQAKQTFIFLMHLAPQVPAVDLFFNANKVSSQPFGFGSVSGTYAANTPGVYEVKFKKGGGDSVIATVPLAAYDSLRAYTLVLYNDDLGHGQAMRINDVFTGVSTSKANYRFFHLSPNVDDVDFYIGDTKVEFVRRLADNATDNTYNEFKPHPGGSYRLTVKEAGTSTILAETTTEANLVEGYVYTMFLKGVKNGTGTNALSVGIVRN